MKTCRNSATSGRVFIWLIFIFAAFLFLAQINLFANDEVDSLISELKSSNPKARYKAALRLGKIKDPKAIPALIEALNDKGSFRHDKRMPSALRDDKVQGYISLALGEIGSPAVEPLIAALNNPDPFVRKGVINALARINDPRVVGPVINALSDNDNTVSRGVPRMLGCIYRNIKDERIPVVLRNRAQSENEIIRCTAISVLGEEVKDTESLILALDDSSSMVRNEAINWLGKNKSKESVDILIKQFNQTKDDNEHTLSYILTALERIGDARAIEPLQLALAQRPVKVNERNLKGTINEIQKKNGLKPSYSWYETIFR